MNAKRSARQFLSRAYYGLFRQEAWNIGIVHEPIRVFLESNARPTVHWFPPTKREKYFGDPFAVIRKETVYIFCEEFDYRPYRGRIACFEFDSRRYPSIPKLAIELPVHMSYPYLIEHEGETYCVPETYQAREVALYKAEQFPLKWKKTATLVENFAGLDPTVFQYDGYWWLVCAVEDGGPWDKLFIWYASDLFGPWRPHQANPAKRDVRSSRPAGTPFVHDGSLYRPAQDCSRTYGGRIVINRILKLTPSQFEEEQAAVIEPYSDGPYPNGVHTISAVGEMTVLDGKCFRFVPSAFKPSLDKGLKEFGNWIKSRRNIVTG